MKLLIWGLMWLALGICVGFTIVTLAIGAFGNNTIDLAPNGMAYCPADSTTPHPTPCMFRQP